MVPTTRNRRPAHKSSSLPKFPANPEQGRSIGAEMAVESPIFRANASPLKNLKGVNFQSPEFEVTLEALIFHNNLKPVYCILWFVGLLDRSQVRYKKVTHGRY